MNFFQPSFKLAAKSRDGARVSKRYHPPQTPCDRLLQADSIPTDAKDVLRQISTELDPLKLLEEMRAVQAYLAALPDGETPPQSLPINPIWQRSWQASRAHGEPAKSVRPSREAKPRYLRGLQNVSAQTCRPAFFVEPKTLPPTAAAVAASAKMPERPRVIYAESGHAKVQALRMVWPIACRRLEGLPNISATQLFEELSIQFPGRSTQRQYKTLLRHVNRWREDARARDVVVGPIRHRRLSDKPRGRRPDNFKEHWAEMVNCLEERPDQTALELLVEFQARYPGRYSARQLHTLQRRVRA